MDGSKPAWPITLAPDPATAPPRCDPSHRRCSAPRALARWRTERRASPEIARQLAARVPGASHAAGTCRRGTTAASLRANGSDPRGEWTPDRLARPCRRGAFGTLRAAARAAVGGGEFARKLHLVELVLPTGDDKGGDAVADEVGQRPRLAHEAIDAEDERQAGDGIDGTTVSVAASVMKPAPVTPDAPFEVSIATRAWSAAAAGELDVERLGDEQRRHSQVDVGAVEIEGVARWNDQSDDRLEQPSLSSFCISGTSADSETRCRAR